MNVAAIVLAGGRSTRLGVDKAGVTVGGVSLLQRTLDAVVSAGVDVASVVVVGDHAPAPFTSVGDADRFAGPLAAVACGADALPLDSRAVTHAFVLGCDHPFVQPSLLRLLVERRDERRSCCLVDGDGRVQYLLGIHPRQRFATAATLVTAGERSLAAWLASDTTTLTPEEWHGADPDGRSLLDVDTPDDLARARRGRGFRYR